MDSVQDVYKDFHAGVCAEADAPKSHRELQAVPVGRSFIAFDSYLCSYMDKAWVG